MAVITQNMVQIAIPQNQLVPDEGPKCIPIRLNFVTAAEYDLDMTILQQQGFISMIQCLFIDASLATVDTSVVVPLTGQVIKAKASTQGYYAILCPNPPRLSFLNSSGVDQVVVFLINAPISGMVWGT